MAPSDPSPSFTWNAADYPTSSSAQYRWAQELIAKLGLSGNSMNRVDIEAAVFRPENMEYLTGDYGAFLYTGEVPTENVLRVILECFDPDHADKKRIEDYFIERFLKYTPGLSLRCHDGTSRRILTFSGPGQLGLH